MADTRIVVVQRGDERGHGPLVLQLAKRVGGDATDFDVGIPECRGQRSDLAGRRGGVLRFMVATRNDR